MTTSGPLPMMRPRGKTEILASTLRKRILAGEWDDGRPMPTEHALCAEYGVTRQTVRPAYDRLIGEGLVIRQHGVGHFVHRISPITLEVDRYETGDGASGRDGLDQWERAIADQGRAPRQEVSVYVLSDPDDPVGPLIRGLLLPGDPDGDILVRDRVCFVDEVPFMLRNSYFPMRLAEGTILMKSGDQVAPGGLLAAIGRPAARWRDQWRARMPYPDEASRLRLPQVTPVVHWIRQRLDADGIPLAVMSAVLPGDRVQLADTITAA